MIENQVQQKLQCVYDFCKTTARTELTRCLKLRSSAMVANEVVKKSGVFKVESCETFESSLTKLSLYAKIRPLSATVHPLAAT